jgi:hypothetical protein
VLTVQPSFEDCFMLFMGMNSASVSSICRRYKFMYTKCNWKVRKNFGHEFHIPKQEKISIWTCIPKHLVSELKLNEYCTCMMVLRHILAVLCEMFSVTPIITDG